MTQRITIQYDAFCSNCKQRVTVDVLQGALKPYEPNETYTFLVTPCKCGGKPLDAKKAKPKATGPKCEDCGKRGDLVIKCDACFEKYRTR